MGLRRVCGVAAVAVVLMLAGAVTYSLIGTTDSCPHGKEGVLLLHRIATAQRLHHSMKGVYAPRIEDLFGVDAYLSTQLSESSKHWRVELTLSGADDWRATASPIVSLTKCRERLSVRKDGGIQRDPLGR